MVEAANHVIRECRETVFVIVGDGPQKTQVISQLEKLNLLSRFIFLGDVSDSTLSLLYNCADIFVLPSIQEGLGIVLLEAQATEKPVIAFNIGGVREALINGESGLLVKPESRELADALLKLLADRSLRKQMGRKGRAFVKRNFSWDICAARMLKVYQEALAINS